MPGAQSLRIWLRFSCGALFLAAAIGFIHGLQLVHPVDQPCPREGRAEHPTSIHLVPSVVKHQSWVTVPLYDRVLDTELYVCADGLVIGKGQIDENDIASSVATINVATHWVVLAWVTGRLGTYRQSEQLLVVVPSEAESEHADPLLAPLAVRIGTSDETFGYVA